MKADQPIWYPFTQMKLAPEPIHILRGKGTLLFGAGGKSYIDAISSWWTNIHGHAHPVIAQKVFEQFQQLEHVIFAGFTHSPAQEFAERLLDHLPGNISKIFFSDNGSTSVEVAIKMAIQYWMNTGRQRKKIVAFRHAYHGDTFGSMSVSERGAFTKSFHDYLFDVEFISPPTPGTESVCIEQFETIISKHDIAAFIYEPLIMGAGGMLMYEPVYLEKLIGLAKSKNIICIADEVMTGFYRTGLFFASDYCDLKPDIMCMSKGITGGSMALGVTACAQFIFNAFYDDDKLKALYHGHSYTANPLACAAANASLDLLEKIECVNRIQQIIRSHQQFAEHLKNYNRVEAVRQTGTIIAFDIKTESSTNYFNTVRDRMYEYFIESGVLLRPLGNTVYIMPPYCITDEELQQTYQTILNLVSDEWWNGIGKP